MGDGRGVGEVGEVGEGGDTANIKWGILGDTVSGSYKSLCKVAGQSRPYKSPILYKSLPKVAHTSRPCKSLPKVAHISRWARSPIQIITHTSRSYKVAHTSRPYKSLIQTTYTHVSAILVNYPRTPTPRCLFRTSSLSSHPLPSSSRGCNLSGKSSILASSIL